MSWSQFAGRSVVLGLLFVGAANLGAFSLLGPYLPWMDEELSYRDQGAIGGPMQRGAEYRWNVPVITYGFDESFIQYFGSNGVRQVEEAIELLNSLPAASELDPESFPTDVSRVNFFAQALGLVDLKSTTLGLLLEQLGLANAERHVWTLRSRTATSTTTNWMVVRRNYDPLTWLPSSLLNGVLYTYDVIESDNPFRADAIDHPVDPLAAFSFGVAGFFPDAGDYIENLTRDDAGGLAYLLHPLNMNVEQLVPGVRRPDSAGTTNLVDVALRPGVDKLTFQRIHADSGFGAFPLVTNAYVDHYISNGLMVSQSLERVISRPDILFAAADAGIENGVPVYVDRTGTESWVNNDSINGEVTTGGPGVIHGPITITYTTILPVFFNESPFFIDESTARRSFVWGSFDRTTNAPVIYPVGREDFLFTTASLVLNSATGSNTFNWLLVGERGKEYRVETTVDFVNWELMESVSNEGGTVTVEGEIAEGAGGRYYRILPVVP